MVLFRNRQEAGERLAAVLREKEWERPVVLGIPRGGVPVAAVVARALDGELGVVVARKLRAPWQPELAIGAITADGVSYVNHRLAREVGADERYLEEEQARQTEEARRREEEFNSHRRPAVAGRDVIIIDDGIATGATAIAAIRSMKAAGARRVVLAVPVGPPETIHALKAEADDVVCVAVESDFFAIGQFYVDFRATEDAEVKAVLESSRRQGAARDPRAATVARDGVRLAVVLSTPGGAGPFPMVVFVHGLGSGKDSPRNVVIAEHLLDAGFATILFDLSGHGESTRDPRGSEAFIDDLEAVYLWALQQPEVDSSRTGIAGSSLGAVVAVDAVRAGRVVPRALVLRAPPVDEGDLAGLTVPSLVLVGAHDPLLPGVRAAATHCAAVTLSVVPGADHLFEEPGALEEALQRTIEWFKASLGVAHQAVSA